MKKKLFIFSNESIAIQNGKFFCDNIDLKSTPEGLNRKFEVSIFGRKSSKKRSHEIKIKKINVFTNLISYLLAAVSASKNNDVSAMISLQSAINFNGGGHINHSIFWTNLAPQSQGGGEPPSGALAEQITKVFGSFDGFKETFAAKTALIQGSGWGWLAYCKASKSVVFKACANQDPLEASTGLIPLLGVDVWEHAYYLQYKNVRPDYLKAIWSIVNWKNVEDRYSKAII